jgi:hypothetical protein
MSSHIQTHVDSLFVHLFITLVHTQLKLAKVGLESSGQADYMLYMCMHQLLTEQGVTEEALLLDRKYCQLTLLYRKNMLLCGVQS